MTEARPNRELLVARDGIDHQAADMTATFGAGVTLAAAQAALQQHGQWLPIDGYEGESLGDLVSYNSTGPLRLGYGAWRDLLLGAQFRNGRGDLITAGGQTMKNVAGYDLTKFMVGQAGVFGTIETITTRTYRRPDAAMIVSFEPDDRLINRLLPTDVRPQWALHFVDGLLCGYLGDQRTIAFYEQEIRKWEPKSVHRLDVANEIMHRRNLWKWGDTKSVRASVPPARLREFLDAAGLRKWVADPAFGIVLASPDSDEAVSRIRAAAESVGGTVTAWHSRTDRTSMEITTNPAQRALLERLKRAFDPDNTLAPLPWQTS